MISDDNSSQSGKSESRRKHKKVVRWLSVLLLAISGFLCVTLFPAYSFQPDFFAALTFWPAWIWALPGIALCLAAVGASKRTRLCVTFVWIFFLVLVAEEAVGLLRSCVYPGKDGRTSCREGICFRVVSLNCEGGNYDAAEGLLQYAPDVVLLQESPPIEGLRILAKRLFANEGEFVLDGDTAVLARGRVIKTEVSHEHRLLMTGARVVLPSGLQVEAISVHLPPPATAINLLSPDCWREHREDRQQRLERIAAIDKHLLTISQDVPIVIGGDFNAKPWAGATRILSRRLYDTFTKGGFGWPGTGPAHFPLWRVDQIWVSRDFKTISVRSKDCANSDHRVVICDLCRL